MALSFDGRPEPSKKAEGTPHPRTFPRTDFNLHSKICSFGFVRHTIPLSPCKIEADIAELAGFLEN
jgi:hypothetical protein